MRKIAATLIVLICFLPATLYGIIRAAYDIPTASSVPAPEIDLLGKTIVPDGYQWNLQVLNGFAYRQFELAPTAQAQSQDLGVLTQTNLNVSAPGGYRATISIHGPADNLMYSGTIADLAAQTFTENGLYTFTITLEKTRLGNSDYGFLYYNGSFRVSINPEVEISSSTVEQGDVLAVRVYNLFNGSVPSATFDSESINYPIVFLPGSDGVATAYISFNHNFAGGTYNLGVSVGDEHWDFPIVITGDDANFETYYTTIDEANPHPNPDSITRKALDEFNDTIVPLYSTEFDTIKYWSGSFLPPLNSYRVGAGYGDFVYENGEYKKRHSGIDMLASEGTAVLCPAPGRVVYAGYLLNTGYTVVIEHGGGLKSYLYHMREIEVDVGDVVQRGAAIGRVGMTGDALEPHLHYEVRIGNQTINPGLLFLGQGGLFYFPD